MRQLGKSIILSPGLGDSFRVKIFEGNAQAEGFSLMEFRAGAKKTDGTFAPLQVITEASTASILVSIAPEDVALIATDSEVGILYKRTSSAAPQPLGYVPTKTVDRGHRWT
jgi:hypothetical protein